MREAFAPPFALPLRRRRRGGPPLPRLRLVRVRSGVGALPAPVLRTGNGRPPFPLPPRTPPSPLPLTRPSAGAQFGWFYMPEGAGGRGAFPRGCAAPRRRPFSALPLPALSACSANLTARGWLAAPPRPDRPSAPRGGLPSASPDS